MNTDIQNKKPEPAANEIVWAFDLGHPLRLERGCLRSREREKVAQPDEGRQGKTIRGEMSNSWPPKNCRAARQRIG
jgi:hypothetical protein